MRRCVALRLEKVPDACLRLHDVYIVEIKLLGGCDDSIHDGTDQACPLSEMPGATGVPIHFTERPHFDTERLRTGGNIKTGWQWQGSVRGDRHG